MLSYTQRSSSSTTAQPSAPSAGPAAPPRYGHSKTDIVCTPRTAPSLSDESRQTLDRPGVRSRSGRRSVGLRTRMDRIRGSPERPPSGRRGGGRSARQFPPGEHAGCVAVNRRGRPVRHSRRLRVNAARLPAHQGAVRAERRACTGAVGLSEPGVVANVLMVSSPAEIDGTLVSGMMTPSTDETFTRPPGLSDRIRQSAPDYRIGLDWDEYWDQEEQFLDGLDSFVESRRSPPDFLAEREAWRLFVFVFAAPDRLQHLIWGEEVILEHHRRVDDMPGDVFTSGTAPVSRPSMHDQRGYQRVRRDGRRGRLREREGPTARSEVQGVTMTGPSATRAVRSRASRNRTRVPQPTPAPFHPL